MTAFSRNRDGVTRSRPRAGPLIVTITGVLIAGCAAVGPDYVAPDVNPPVRWSGDPGAAATTDPLEPAALNEWWRSLDDPVLTELIERALAGNLGLRDAEARIRAARARRGVTAASQLPTVEAGGAVTDTRITETGFYEGTGYAGTTQTLYEGGFDASWEVDIFGRVRRQVEAADAGLEASVESYRDVLVTLLAEVARNYLDVRTLQARLAVARANREAQINTVELVQESVDAGETARLDLEQARANLATTRAIIPGLESNLAQAKNRLAVALGLAPGALDEELADPRAIPLAPPQVALGVPAEVLRRRPDVRRAERELAVATAAIGVATADLYPTLTLVGSVGLESLDAGRFLSSASGVFGIGPSLQWNVFDAGRIRSNIEVVSAEQEQTLIAYEAAVLNALQDVENSIVAYGKEMVRRQALVDGEQFARQALAIAEDQYKAGETSFLSVLDSQRQLLGLQDQLAASNGQVTTNVISLFKALGGGWTPLEPNSP
mgnify:FL=1